LPSLIIDNYDSFTFNLVHAIAVITGEMPIVVRNDEMTWDEIRRLDFDSVIISPGPGRPDRPRDFGVSRDVILHADVPVLGVCLGHQGIALAYGGCVARTAPVHGRASEVFHDGDRLFDGIPEHFSAIRYHSLVVPEPLPPELRRIAWTADGTLMGLRHVSKPVWGVQFHPESILTEYGQTLLRNFLASRRTNFRRVPLRHAPEVLFRQLFARERYSFWLDSAAQRRFSYMGSSADIYTSGPENVLDHIEKALLTTKVAAQDVPFPFTGGYVGYLGYELKSECGASAKHVSPLPDCMLLRVENFLAIDHFEAELYVVGDPQWQDSMLSRIADLNMNTQPARLPARPAPEPRFAIGRDGYLERVEQCLAHIADGESYELCLTNKLTIKTGLPPLDYYERLRRTNPAPYSAYLNLGEIQVASTSPECFLRIDGRRQIESRPIKGTIRRGRTPEEDACLRQKLATGERFRAENLMIVDLVRNDLSRVCEPGTVEAPRLMEVETYETLHQLVSTITGQLTPEANAVTCLRALFPGGSMTGAPKLRTMELLDELEPEARGIYSGAIGYLGFNGCADLSIVIRTAVFHKGAATLGVGGAIVAQSDPGAEWDEIELKAKALLRAFEPG
jgi:para-aminobenzoate synthetase